VIKTVVKMEPVKYTVKETREFEILAEKFKAIGHPDRVAILNLLCTCNCSKLTVKSVLARYFKAFNHYAKKWNTEKNSGGSKYVLLSL